MNKPESMVVIDQQAPHKLRGGIAATIAIAILLVISVGVTYAALYWEQWTGNQTPNRVSAGEVLTCDLLEPAWTNAALTDNGVAANATSSTTVTAAGVKYFDQATMVAIPKGATTMVPGSQFRKNPFIVNTATVNTTTLSNPEESITGYGFAAMKIQFQKVNTEGEWVDITSAEDVKAILDCYYIGKLEGEGEDQTFPDSETTADFELGENWYELDYGVYGAMYFINSKRLEPLGMTVFKGMTPASVPDDTTSNISTSTWGYDATASSKYATTELFQVVRYVDSTTQAKINALRKALDNDEDNDGIGEVSANGHTPGWKMVISSAIIESRNDTDSVLDGDDVDTTTSWYLGFKDVLDEAEKTTVSTGARSIAKNKLGAYLTVTETNTDGTAKTAKVIGGTGVPEPVTETE